MATDVAPPTDGASDVIDAVSTPRSVHRRRGVLLLLAAAFNLWLWVTRIRNLAQGAGEVDAAFIAVHAVLYTTAIAVAVVVGIVGWRQFREARRSGGGEPRA